MNLGLIISYGLYALNSKRADFDVNVPHWVDYFQVGW